MENSSDNKSEIHVIKRQWWKTSDSFKNNSEILTGFDTDKIINELYDSLFHMYQVGSK